MKTFLCVLALLSGTAVVQAAPVAKPVAAPVVAEPLAEKDGLKISIATERFAADNADDERTTIPRIWLSSVHPFVQVVLQNTSTKAINLSVTNSAGGVKQFLSLELTTIDGKTLNVPLIVSQPYVRVGANVAYLQAIAPGEVLVLEIQLPTPDILQSNGARRVFGEPSVPLKDANAKMTLRAIFADSNDYNWAEPGHKPTPVWKGKVVSPFVEYQVHWNGN